MRSPLVWFDTEHKGEVAAKEGPALELLGFLLDCVENNVLKTMRSGEGLFLCLPQSCLNQLSGSFFIKAFHRYYSVAGLLNEDLSV